MITIIIILLTLCVGIVLIFLASMENIDKDIKIVDEKYKNEMKIINHRFNLINDNILQQDVEVFKLKEKNIQLEKQTKELELQILKLKDIDSSKYY